MFPLVANYSKETFSVLWIDVGNVDVDKLDADDPIDNHKDNPSKSK